MSKVKKFEYKVKTKNIKKRIVLLADIHYFDHKEHKYMNNVLKELKLIKYDFLCIAGDLLDRSIVKDSTFLLDWLKELGSLSKVFIIIGNHDVTNNRKTYEYELDDKLFKKINKIKNVVVLDNKVMTISGINFIGLTLPIDYYYKYKENVNYFIRYTNNLDFDIDESTYNVLLCHSPIPFFDKEVIKSTKVLEHANLILAGHMHGGITPKWMRRLLKGRGLIGPRKNLLPKNTYGKKSNGVQDIIITSGVTTASNMNPFSFTNRLFSPEITIIDLVKKI